MEFVIVLAVLVVVVLVVFWPFRGGTAAKIQAGAIGDPAAEIAELEAAREAKYREIRDAELDHRTGKLSDADYEAVDRTLRAEAMEILNALDGATGK
jgi:hypothetical protein